jgi:hypothetical protein
MNGECCFFPPGSISVHELYLLAHRERSIVDLTLARIVLNRSRCVPVVRKIVVVHISASRRERMMDELNGKMIACQILITGLIARVANEQRDPLRFLTEFRDEIKAVVKGVNIAGMDNTDRVRAIAQQTVDELFSLMKPPSSD